MTPDEIAAAKLSAKQLRESTQASTSTPQNLKDILLLPWASTVERLCDECERLRRLVTDLNLQIKDMMEADSHDD